MKNTTRRQAGFTLVEILVTTAIIGILIGLVLGISGLANKRSDEGKARAEMQQIGNSIEQYRVVYGSVPDNLPILTNATTQVAEEYKKLRLTDPWGRNYNYTKSGRYTYRLWTEGPKKNTSDATTQSDDIESGAF